MLERSSWGSGDLYLCTASRVGIASATADPPSVLKSSLPVLGCYCWLPGLPLAAWCQLPKGIVIRSGGQLMLISFSS